MVDISTKRPVFIDLHVDLHHTDAADDLLGQNVGERPDGNALIGAAARSLAG